jgi:hypothetical protein
MFIVKHEKLFKMALHAVIENTKDWRSENGRKEKSRSDNGHSENGKCTLNGQCHEIFDPHFFHQSTPPRVLIHGLKPFRIRLRIRRENRCENRQNRTFLSEFPFNISFFW